MSSSQPVIDVWGKLTYVPSIAFASGVLLF
jgi:hypothetical protein